MFLKLLLAFLLIPLAELYLLLRIADYTGVWTTIGLVIFTGVLGSFLARREGRKVWRRFRESMAEGRMPTEEIQDGLMVVFAAALLLTPGVITDTVGLIMLIPAGRHFLRKRFVAPMISGMQVRWVHVQGGVAGRGDVVDGEVVYRDTDPSDQKKTSSPKYAPLPLNVIDAESVKRRF
jgi:UPF0716 protein FxsA